MNFVSLVTTKWMRTRRAAGVAVALAVALLPVAACTGGSGSAGHGTGPGSPASAPSAVNRTAPPFPVAENGLAGTSSWRITDLGPADAIEGYADQQSVLPGQSFRHREGRPRPP